jgi:hypothetical protein
MLLRSWCWPDTEWDRPDNAFADAVRTLVASNIAPDFEMSARTGERMRSRAL